jgi:hypothetical protein
MNLFAGLSTTDYQDVLRAVGALLDEQHLRDVRLWEHEEGLVIQGRADDETGGRYQTFLLTDEDIRNLLVKAYSRRRATDRRLLTGA